MTIIRLAGIVLVALTGCRRAEPVESEAKGAEPAPPTASIPEDFLWGYETRDHELWLHTGTDPQLYTVKTKDGKTLAEGIDDSQLKRDYPLLHEIVHDGVDLLGIGYSGER